MDQIKHILKYFTTPDSPIHQLAKKPDQSQVIRASGNIVGILGWWQNDFHPEALYFAVALSPLPTNKTCAEISAMMNQVAQQHNKSLMVLREALPQSPFTHWAAAHGFRAFRQTVRPLLTLNGLSTTPVTALSFNQLTDQQKDDLVQLSYAQYQAVHIDNPVCAFEPESWRRVAFADLILDAPIITIENGQIEAYCLVYEDTADTVEWGWLYGHKLNQLLKLQREQISWLAPRYQYVRGEFDSTDTLADHSRLYWPFAPAVVEQTYSAPVGR